MDIDGQPPHKIEAIFNEQKEHSLWNDTSSMNKLVQHVHYCNPATCKSSSAKDLYRRWLGGHGDGNEISDENPELCLSAIVLYPVEDR